MSYDIYLYKSKSGRPDLTEANSAIEITDESSGNTTSHLKELIARELTAFNPRLEIFIFDYNEISKIQNISVDEAKRRFDYIEINTRDEDLATQITIHANTVSLSIPYWYSGDKAKEVFKLVDQYLKIIHKVSGFFVFDPQTNSVYSPVDKSFDGLEIYNKTVRQVEQMTSDDSGSKKPWWKFW